MLSRRPLPLSVSFLLGFLLGACSNGRGETPDGGGDLGTEGQGAEHGPETLPQISGLTPATHPGGEAFELTVDGTQLAGGEVLLAGAPIPTTGQSAERLLAQVPPQKRGTVAVTVRTAAGVSAPATLTITNSPPSIEPIADQRVDEDAELQVTLKVSDFDGDPPRVFVAGLPPCARFDETKRLITVAPDFTEGGPSFTITVAASDGSDRVTQTFQLQLVDSITPPWPAIVSSSDAGDHTALKLAQSTDTYLDSPGYAGRSFEAWVGVPKSASATNKLPVHVVLHGFDNPVSSAGSGSEFVINPGDPMDTYWWGYSDQLPDGTPTQGTVPAYTMRRVLHLVEWVLHNQPGANPEAVYVTGSSMGGAGALLIGLLGARHFCYVEGIIGQAIARNHRPLRVAQLSTLWGTPDLNLLDSAGGMGVWDRQDMTRALRDSPEARNQFIFTKHSKDDDTIHFGAVVMASPLTGMSFYQALHAHRPGAYAVWDEGGHGPADPVLGDFWSDWGWNRVSDGVTYLRRNLAFPAFSSSSADWNPGDGKGNGKQPWDVNKGYAGIVTVPGDTGWDGDIAGAFNRFLRWDSTSIVDTEEKFEIQLKVLDGDGKPAPAPGYPSIGNKLDAALPVVVDVTPRRVQHFVCLPGENVNYSFGGATGTVTADAEGVVTVPALKLTTTFTPLHLERAAP